MRGNVRLTHYRGSWYAVWIEGGETRRRSLRTKDRGAAERTLIDFKVALAGPLETVEKIMDAYIADRAAAPRILWSWKRLQPFFGNMRPKDVTRQVCRAYIERRKQDVSDGTILRELGVLRAALRWHDRNTPAVIEVPRQPPPRTRYLKRDEYHRLRLAAARTPHCELFIILAYTTAGRASAVLDLTWDRIDFERGIIRLGEATGIKGRATVPMTPSARDALLRARQAATTNFVIEYGGKRVLKIRKAFDNAAARAGMPDVTPHVLRHTAAVHMAEAGVPMTEIAAYLGHTNTTITFKVYARYSPEYLRKAAEALE